MTTDKIRVTILPTGTVHADLQWLLVDPARMLTRNGGPRERDWVDVPTHVVYVEHPNGQKMLWDAGVPRDWETRWAPMGFDETFPIDGVPEEDWLDSRLRQLEIGPDDVDLLVLSHLHIDHVGNAQLWAGTSTTIIVDEAEKAGAFSFDGANLGAHLRSDYDGLDLTTIAADTELMPGVTALRTPGHTWGTLSLQVDLADSGTMIFASDALYRSESYGPPALPAAIVHDTVAWFASVEKIRGIAERTDGQVIFGHDADQLRTLRTGVGNSYT